MSKVREYLVFLSAAIMAFSAIAIAKPRSDKQGVWSTAAIDVSVGDSLHRSLVVPSPDDLYRARIHDHTLLLHALDGKAAQFGLYYLAELAWAPDSRVLFITQSDGGATGTWFVRSYILESDRVREVDLSAEPKSQFADSKVCPALGNETPNVMGVAWVNGSQDVLVIARAPFHSPCSDKKAALGFLVNANTGHVTARFTFGQVQKRWGRLLGRGFRASQ
jgi:hypothetical protein